MRVHLPVTEDGSSTVRWTLWDPAAARDQFAALVPVNDRILGPAHRGTLGARYQLARWTGQAGDAPAARDQLAALLSVDERVLGAEHPQTLADRHELANWTKVARDPRRAPRTPGQAS